MQYATLGKFIVPCYATFFSLFSFFSFFFEGGGGGGEEGNKMLPSVMLLLT